MEADLAREKPVLIEFGIAGAAGGIQANETNRARRPRARARPPMVASSWIHEGQRGAGDPDGPSSSAAGTCDVPTARVRRRADPARGAVPSGAWPA